MQSPTSQREACSGLVDPSTPDLNSTTPQGTVGANSTRVALPRVLANSKSGDGTLLRVNLSHGRSNSLHDPITALTTANGRHLYQLYDTLAQEAHRHFAEVNGWAKSTLRPGQFGYDNMVTSVAWVALMDRALVFDFDTPRQLTVEEAADLIHQGWTENYLYWRDQKPFLQNRGYQKPAKPLGDPRRDSCAQATFAQLPPDEQEKDLVLARFLIKRLIESGLTPSILL